MHRFYWLIENVLAGCSRPGAHNADIDRDLRELWEHGVGAVLTLTETSLASGSLERHGLLGLHLPVDDFHAPTTGQMLEALAFIDEARADGLAVAVHCLAGQGRTGTVLAAYLIRGGLAPSRAIAAVRTLCPGAIESAPQTAALSRWGDTLPWLI